MAILSGVPAPYLLYSKLMRGIISHMILKVKGHKEGGQKMDLYETLAADLEVRLSKIDPGKTYTAADFEVTEEFLQKLKTEEAKERYKHRHRFIQLLTDYLNWYWRQILAVPREVFVSEKLEKKLNGTELSETIKRVVRKIQCDLERGENLSARLSTQTQFIDRNDLLLNEQGIYHLHLGENLVSREGRVFYERTGALLFAYIPRQEAKAYLIDVIADHAADKNPDAFTDASYLETLRAEYPEVFRSYEISGVHPQPTGIDIHFLRSKRMNTIDTPQGMPVANLGGGYTSAGGSKDASLIATQMVKDIPKWEKKLGEAKSQEKNRTLEVKIHGATISLIDGSSGQVLHSKPYGRFSG